MAQNHKSRVWLRNLRYDSFISAADLFHVLLCGIVSMFIHYYNASLELCSYEQFSIKKLLVSVGYSTSLCCRETVFCQCDLEPMQT